MEEQSRESSKLLERITMNPEINRKISARSTESSSMYRSIRKATAPTPQG